MEMLKAKLEKYLLKAEPAFEEIIVLSPQGEKVKDTALRYFSDSKHFFERGEFVNSFAALEYAEGWLDAGVTLGVLTAKGKQIDGQ
jgi:uncharacterized protein